MQQGNFINVLLAQHVWAHMPIMSSEEYINKITLLHQVGISNYLMRKTHGQTTLKKPG